MKKLITAIILFTPALFGADPPAIKVDGPNPEPPVIRLPDETPRNVAAFDANAVKARAVPYHVAMVKAPEAWAKNPAAKGRGVKIAVIDTWGQTDHPGFDGKVKRQYSAITKKLDPPRPANPHAHCTHAAGIVHAIAPEAELYFIEALNSKGEGSVVDIAHGIDYAASVFQVDVISLSLGGPVPDEFMPAAIKRAYDAGVVTLAASGNAGGGPGRDTEGYPARYDGATSVAACDENRNLATFSSWGPSVFTVKPGVTVTSLLPDNREGDMSGTSMACPNEAGAAASWIASNAIPREKGRSDHYRAAVRKASPFQERNNARGYGLYTLDRITGEASTPGPVPLPPLVGNVALTWADLTPAAQERLKKGGFTDFDLKLKGSGQVDAPKPSTAQPIPVQSVPATAPQFHPATQFGQPVPTWSGFNPAPVFAPPPPPVYQPMPQFARPPVAFSIQGPLGGSIQFTGGCPGGVCPVRR